MTAIRDADEPLYRAFIGKLGLEHYLAYFARADARGYPPISWHWPALFFGVLWLIYRKLYRVALIAFLVPYVAMAIGAGAEHLVAKSGNAVAWALLFGFFAVWLPLNAHALRSLNCYRHIEEKTEARIDDYQTVLDYKPTSLQSFQDILQPW